MCKMKRGVFPLLLIIFVICSLIFVIVKAIIFYDINYKEYIGTTTKEEFVTETQNSEKPNSTLTYNDGRISLFKTFDSSYNDIIFIGDSLTNGCEWAELSRNSNAKNRGINGDTSIGVLNRFDEICEGHPKIIFLLVGINDLGYQWSSDIVLDTFNQIVDIYKKISPDTKLVIQSVLPINRYLTTWDIKDTQIKELNAGLNLLADKENLIFVDLYSIFVDGENNLKDEYTYDGIHLNGKGYMRWYQKIDIIINQH